MDLDTFYVSPAVQTALQILEKRELAKVKRLQAVLDGDEFTPELASQLNAARDQLQTDPTRIYLILGELLAQDETIVQLTSALGEALSGNWGEKAEGLRQYVKCELLVRREADNKLAELTFKLLMRAKTA